MPSIIPQDFAESQNPIQFFLDPPTVWEAMYADCKAATQSIDFEQYILNNDEVGQRFLKLFADKAAEGVQVRLLLDRVGSRSVYETEWVKAIKEKGGHVHFYGGRSWLNIFVPWRWFPRNHTKVMLIDSKIAYIGSACIEKDMSDWRDTQIRLVDILANDIKAEFQLTWNNVIERKKKKPYYASPSGKTWRYVVNQPRIMPNPIYRELLREIRHAKKAIYLATPYFVPPWPLRRALGRAVKRGVKVNIMMAEKSDVTLADNVSRSYFYRLLRKRINIFLYQKNVLHTKYAVIDDQWATIGSTNMDYLSLMHNREANVITSDEKVIDELESHFNNDLKDCIKVDKAYYKSIPLKTKIIGHLGRVMRRFL